MFHFLSAALCLGFEFLQQICSGFQQSIHSFLVYYVVITITDFDVRLVVCIRLCKKNNLFFCFDGLILRLLFSKSNRCCLQREPVSCVCVQVKQDLCNNVALSATLAGQLN